MFAQSVEISKAMWEAVEARYLELKKTELLHDVSLMLELKKISKLAPDSLSTSISITEAQFKFLKDSHLTINLASDFKSEINAIEHQLNIDCCDAMLSTLADTQSKLIAAKQRTDQSDKARMQATILALDRDSSPSPPLPPTPTSSPELPSMRNT